MRNPLCSIVRSWHGAFGPVLLFGCCLLGLAGVTALSAAPTSVSPPASDTGHPPRNVILMISDGVGFNAWLAADYYQHGRAGANAYQTARRVGEKTYPVQVLAHANGALNFLNAEGKAIAAPGDGSVPAAARTATGQARTMPQGGENGYQPERMWSEFTYASAGDYAGNSITAEGDGLPYTAYTDSAAAITAFITGQKTTVGRINHDASGDRLKTLAEYFKEANKAVGAVSSVYFTHATPAGVAAHNVSRRHLADIARAMLTGNLLDVIIGPGHPMYDSDGRPLPQGAHFERVGGEAMWQKITGGQSGFDFFETRESFELLARHRVIAPKKLLGIPQVGATLQASRSHNRQVPDYGKTTPVFGNPSGDPFVSNMPSLATLSQVALNALSQNENGFFVMIEGGAPDWMNHANHLPRMVEEQIDFNQAVEAVIAWVETHSSWDETLLIVTSDHETGGVWGAGTFTHGIGQPGKKDLTFHPGIDRFERFLAVQNAGIGVLPAVQYASIHHTHQLVPLWALGAGSEQLSALATRHDPAAAMLWGSAYGWNGRYLENTDLFTVMKRGATK